MNQKKKQIREEFRTEVFKRDKWSCVMCGVKSSPSLASTELDAHHITSRTQLPAQGMVPENGISLCADCHLKAEQYWSTGTPYPGYSQENLYAKIGSSYEKALEACEKIK